ncbi:hypothetical protein AVEN_198143-1 [Araneus ventricosus]|uniref:Uncharacterized protein n=1 Tax=Araneus ventricosus TaxID=182803 RepID=A0A4Y2JG97_ARAVE|nr:hypothetical protein AVEN_198143-1 [Araneus ventricosus]
MQDAQEGPLKTLSRLSSDDSFIRFNYSIKLQSEMAEQGNVIDRTGLNRPLQWCICLLQTNELPLRHLLNSLDGATTCLKEFCRPICKKIKSCEELPLTPFSSISVENIPENIDRMVLSNDQQYIYDICLAISRGEYYSDMVLRKPVPVAHSRWITFAGRILSLYVVTEKPSNNLIILARYMQPVWFHVKTKPSITEGARHIWRLLIF